jgi:hypothetical protein
MTEDEARHTTERLPDGVHILRVSEIETSVYWTVEKRDFVILSGRIDKVMNKAWEERDQQVRDYQHSYRR